MAGKRSAADMAGSAEGLPPKRHKSLQEQQQLPSPQQIQQQLAQPQQTEVQSFHQQQQQPQQNINSNAASAPLLNNPNDSAPNVTTNNENNGASSSVPQSAVIHLRSLPLDATDQDLHNLASPFGLVLNCLILKGKHQAFLEMQSPDQAAAVIQYYNNVPAIVRGKTAYMQFSKRSTISNHPPKAVDSSNNILLVTVLHLLYPITISVLHQIFHKYGDLQKIVIFTKKGNFQSLVQFGNVDSAMRAKAELDGQNVYTGCCTLKIQFSTLSTLNVKYNNEKSRDFNNPSLPAGPQPGVLANAPLLDNSLLGVGGYPVQDGLLPQAQQQWPSVPQMPQLSPMAHMPQQPQLQQHHHHQSHYQTGGSNSGLVLIVSGLGNSITPDMLFTLFGVYGDVVRVKILYNKKDTALLQFSNTQQAETALSFLNGMPFRGNALKINFSRHATISLPRNNRAEDDPLTRDYTGHPLHRYKFANSKNFLHITAPSAVLHVSNVAPGVTEEIAKEHFGAFGQVTNFKFFPDRKMFLIELNGIEEAVECLIHLHDSKLADQKIRVSFSKSSI